MNVLFRADLGHGLSRWPHIVLAAHLFLIHLLAFGGWQVPAVRLLWLVALGLFLIWQPFVDGEQRISHSQGALLFSIAVATTVILGPWLLLIWCGALAAVIGGRVIWTESRRERVGYLLAFGYLVALTVFGVVPEISSAVVFDRALRDVFSRALPALLPALLFFPAPPLKRRAGDAFDLFYGVLVFLVLAVFVLGALSYVLIGRVGYVEALIQTSLTLAGALLVVAWAWNPRAGFSGVGAAISRYLLSVGMPLEQWLVQLSEESDRETQPEQFLAAAMRRLEPMPWVTGVAWKTAASEDRLGLETAHCQAFRMGEVVLTVHFRYSPSPAMRWHTEWLLRLAAEFYLIKRQNLELQRMGYLQAVYETGARVTHDVKNLLQSMQVLCYAAARPGNPAEVASLLGRQLPQITERLKATLEKLQSPRAEMPNWADAGAWWLALQDRYASADLLWQGEAARDTRLPQSLFDSVAENLLQNALAKRQRCPELTISVHFADGVLRVTDNGAPIPPTQAALLMSDPVVSEDGLGIGLFHAARQAEGLGYVLELAENREGCVAFRLAPRA